MFEFNEDTKSHMPFVAYGNAPKFAPKAFCCLMVNGKWKLHHFDEGEWKRIPTGLPDDATECSPTAEFVNEKWQVSFVAGGFESDRRFYLYKIDGIGSTPEKVIPADVGFIWKNRIIYGNRLGELFIADGNKTQKLTFTDVEYLYRVSYNPDNPQELLISGQDKNGELFSWICNITARTLQSLCIDCNPAYKAALFGDKCYYTYRNDTDYFEDRHILESTDFTRKNLDFTTVVKVETIASEPSTLEMLQHFTSASFKWAKSGFKFADESTLSHRREICLKCEFWKPNARMGMGKCLKCGCTSMKLKFATEKCPTGKW